MKSLQVRIDTQGAVDVNYGVVYKKARNVVALEIDLYSKYCEVTCIGTLVGPVLGLSAGKNSMHLKKGAHRDDTTYIELPEFVGWDVWSASISKYSLFVCLTREAK